MKKQISMQGRNADGFMSGVLVLSLSTVIVKVIGLAYKIPMIAYLGAEGMGYFNSAYEIYAILCVIATAGLPVALSLLISANRQNGAEKAVRKIDRSATVLFVSLGLFGTLFLLFFAKPISRIIGNEDAFFCILAIAPALFFVCFSSAVRGYFQGFNKMLPTAISQLIEALGKLIFGVWFASIALRRELEIPLVASCAILGLSLGTFLSALYLLVTKIIFCRTKNIVVNEIPSSSPRDGVATLLRIAIPITLSSAVLSVTRLVDMSLIMRRLQDIGCSAVETNEIYGAYTTLAVSVFSLLPSLIAPISMVLVPQLAAAIERKNTEDQSRLADRSIRLTTMLAMPASMGITVYAAPILTVLFSNERRAIEIAAPLLSVLGLSVLFSGMITTTNAILQSYRQAGKPIISMSVGAIVKIVSAYLLIGTPSVGIFGAPISTLLCDLTITSINLYFLGKAIPKSRHSEGMLQIYYKPLAASLLSILMSLLVYFPISRREDGKTLAFFTALLVAVLAYAVFAVLFKMITEEDMALLPMGKKILSVWRAFQNIKKRKKEKMKYDRYRKN